MSTNKIIVGALVGLAAGAVIAVLFAPEKGSVVRRKMATKSGDYLDSFKDKYNNIIDTLSSKLDEVAQEDAAANDIDSDSNSVSTFNRL